MANNTWVKKILHFPLTKIIIGVTILALVVSLAQMGMRQLLRMLEVDPKFFSLISGIVVAALSIITYYLLFRFYEKRTISELSTQRLARNLLLGFILGAVLQSLTILVIYLIGGYSIVAINPIIYILSPLAMAFTSAIFEEILVRGIIFRIMEEKLGSYIALIISALIFGALHLANPNATIATAFGLAIQAGLLLGVAFIYSKNLWFPIAIHFAWNFMQSAIYGANVSGNAIKKTLIISKIEGPDWLTGGEFGPEGSIQATLFCFIATLILLILCHKQNKIIPPVWRREFRP